MIPRSIIRHGTKNIIRLERYLHIDIPIESLPDPSEESVLAFKRLNNVRNILPNSRFRNSVQKCIELYGSTTSNMLNDIFDYPKLHEDVFKYLCKNYWKSNSIRCLILDNLFKLWIHKQYGKIKIIEKSLQHEKIFHQVLAKKETVQTERDISADTIVRLAVSSGEPLAAARLVVSFKENDVKIAPITLNTVIMTLTNHKGHQEQLNNLALLRICDKFPEVQFSPQAISSILTNSGSQTNDVYMLNLLFSKLYPNILEFGNNPLIVSAIKELIFRNMHFGDYKKALEIWNDTLAVKPVSTDSDIHLRLLKNLEGRDIQEFIEKAQLDLGNMNIVCCLIKYYGANPSTFSKCETLILNLQSPVPRSILSALFSVFLNQNKTKEIESVSRLLIHSKEGIMPQDFNEIIKKMISEGNLDEAVLTVSSADISKAKFAYITAFEHIISSNNQSHNAFLKTIPRKLESIDANIKDPVLPIVIRYFCERQSIPIARSLFASISKLEPDQISVRQFELPDLKKHSLFNEIYDMLTVTPQNLKESLLIILEFSTKAEDIPTLKWCIEELRANGYLIKGILERVKFHNKDFFNRSFQTHITKMIK